MKRYRTSSLITGALGALAAGALGLALWQAPQGVAQEQQPILEYPAYPPTPTIGANPAARPEAGVQAAPLAAASFDDASALAAWEVVDFTFVLEESRSVWGVEQGRLEQQNTAAAGNPSIQETGALTGAESWSDYTVQVSFYDQLNGTAGLVARYSGADPQTASYYRYRILKNEYEATPKQVLERVSGGVATSLVEIAAPGFTPREWHVLALRVEGSALTVTLDGVVVAEAEDPAPLAAGRAGVYTRAMGGILFDDFIVTAP
jgi:hypothetical protein